MLVIMRLIINLCCFSLPPSLEVLGKGVGMKGEGGMEGRVEAEREEGLPISPSPSSKPWKKQAAAPTPAARQPSWAAYRNRAVWAQASGLVGASAVHQLLHLVSAYSSWEAKEAEPQGPREHLFSHTLTTPIIFLHFPHWESQKGRW